MCKPALPTFLLTLTGKLKYAFSINEVSTHGIRPYCGAILRGRAFLDAVEGEAERLGQQEVEERGERGGERSVECEGVARAVVVEEWEGGGDEESEGEGQRHQPADELRAVARGQQLGQEHGPHGEDRPEEEAEEDEEEGLLQRGRVKSG